MTGKWFINGIDAVEVYGLCLAGNAYGEFTKLPKRKYEYTNNWPDENGTQRFPVTNPAFETRTLNIPVIQSGSSIEDFIQKQAAFFELVKQGGYWVVDVEDLNKRWELLFDGASESTAKGMLHRGLILDFLDDWVTESYDILDYLIDENGNFIADTDNILIADT